MEGNGKMKTEKQTSGTVFETKAELYQIQKKYG